MKSHESFGKLVRAYRKSHHLSQQDMAELCNVSICYYQRIEHGKANLGLDLDIYIAAALDNSLDELKQNVHVLPLLFV